MAPSHAEPMSTQLGQTREMQDEDDVYAIGSHDDESYHSESHVSRTPTDDLLEIRFLVSFYVGQLLIGCGDSTCREQMCITGRTNVSQKPVRRFTPRSARSLALSVVSTLTPRKHLCQHYMTVRMAKGQGWLVGDAGVKRGPRDPSSLIQQMSDSTALQELSSDDACASDRLSKAFMERYNVLRACNDAFRTLHVQLDLLSGKPFSRDGSPNITFVAHKEAIRQIRSGLSFLKDMVPATHPTQWRHLDGWISDGNAFLPLNVSWVSDECLKVLESYEYAHSLRMLEKICQVVAFRTKLEALLVSLKEKPEAACTTFAMDVACVLDSDAGLGSSGLASVPESEESISHGGNSWLVIWLKKVFLRRWNGKPTVDRGTIECGALELLSAICRHDREQKNSASTSDKFAIPTVPRRLDASQLAQSWMEFSEVHNGRQTHLLRFPFMFAESLPCFYFRMLNHLKMRTAHSSSEKAIALRRRVDKADVDSDTTIAARFAYAESPYLLFNVSRNHIVRDAFNQVWHRRRGELLRPLRVRLGEVDELEVGHDLGGVQIEFFNLICKAVFSEEAQMFATDATTGLSWFQPCSLQPLYMFELFGVLLSLAVYNGITLPISMPLVFYKQLLGQSCSEIEDIADRWPDAANSLGFILATDDNESLSMDYLFPLEANGSRFDVFYPDLGHMDTAESSRTPDTMSCRLEIAAETLIRHKPSSDTTDVASRDISDRSSQEKAPFIAETTRHWPGWRVTMCASPPELVTKTNKLSYVRQYVQWLTFASIRPQLHTFRRGFYTVLDCHSLSLLTPATFKAQVEGLQHLDINELRRVTRYDGYEPKSRYILCFWRIVMSWPEEKQKDLLKFVTATERVPIGGASALTFCIKKATGVEADYLPTSSTCFGTLQLPKYDSAQILEDKLSLALKYGMEGFGTG